MTTHSTTQPIPVVLVTSEGCHLCADALRAFEEAGSEYPLQVRQVDLESDDGRAIARATRAPMPPIVVVDGQLLGWGRLSRGKLRRLLAELDAGIRQ